MYTLFYYINYILCSTEIGTATFCCGLQILMCTYVVIHLQVYVQCTSYIYMDITFTHIWILSIGKPEYKFVEHLKIDS